MNNFKKSIKQIYERAVKEQNFVYSSYDRYLNDDARAMYNDQFLQKYIDERAMKLHKIHQDASIEINKALEEYQETLLPNKEAINSEAYQMRLANTLQLMQLQNIKIDSEVNTSILDFIVEARDFQTLKLIQNAYNNAYINNYCRENDPQIDIVAAKQLAEGCKKALAGKDDYASQLAVHQIQNLDC